MNPNKVLIIFSIIFLTYSVTCDDVEEIKRRGLIRARQKYRYNHPPSPENYETIPVEVVYDKVIDRSYRGRTIVPNKETDSEESFLVTKNSPEVTSIPENKTEEQVTIDHSVSDANISNKSIKKPEAKNIKLEYKIPVSVVYDEEPQIVRRNRIKYGVGTRLRKPIRKEEKPNSESLEQSELTLNNNKRGSLKPVNSTTEKNSFEKVRQEDSNVEVSGSKQADEYVNQDQPIKYQNAQTDNTKIFGKNKIEKKRINGDPDPIVPIVASENRVFGQNGEFKYSYEGGDGTKAFSKGQLKNVDEVAGEAVEGGFSYKDKDGNDFSISYTADEKGYRPIGAHLPTSPPIPPAIARALAYLATKTTPEPVTEPFDDKENIPVPN